MTTPDERRERSLERFAWLSAGTTRTTFAKWTPRKSDGAIQYWYVAPRDGSLIRCQDRWMRQKAHLAASIIHSGVSEAVVVSAKRTLLLDCSEDDAEAFLQGRIASGAFMLKGLLRSAQAGRARRLASTTTFGDSESTNQPEGRRDASRHQ